MKILFVCHRLPYPPTRGGKIRPFNIIKHLHDGGHEVTVASLARSSKEAEDGLGLRDFCTSTLIEKISPAAANFRMVARLPTPTPSSMGYFYSPKLARRITAAHEHQSFDFIFVHCSSVAGYVGKLRGPAKMFDLGDVDSQKWLLYGRTRRMPLAAGYWLEGLKLQRAELRLSQRFDFCTCTTKAELATFDGFKTGVPSGWFPNGVDADYFAPLDRSYDSDLICFVGRMDYYPNQEAMQTFCATVWPHIRASRPTAKLSIVGADPSESIKSLARLAGVTVTGSVPDVRPYVQHAALTVAPLSIARGTQNKILESMAMGVPVVASVEAVGGVDAVAGQHLFAASEPGEYRDAILKLLGEPAERERLSRAGRSRVLERHSWGNSMQKLDGLVDACLGHASRRESHA